MSAQVAFVPQAAFIFGGSVRDNILFGLPYEECRYQKAVQAAALGPDLVQLPGNDNPCICSSCVGSPVCWQSMSEDGVSDHMAANHVSYIGIGQAYGWRTSFPCSCVYRCVQALVNARAGVTARTHTMLQLASPMRTKS